MRTPRGGIAAAPRCETDRIVVFGGEDGRRHHDHGGRAVRPAARGAGRRSPTCARRATGWAAWPTATACTRSRAGRSRASSSRTRVEALTSASRVPDRPLLPLKDDIPTRRFPIVTRRDHRDQPRRLLRVPGTDLSLERRRRRATSASIKYAAIPYEITHPGDQCAADACGPSDRDARASGVRRALPTRPLADDLHRDVHARQDCCTSAATCCSCGSSGTTSRTP